LIDFDKALAVTDVDAVWISRERFARLEVEAAPFADAIRNQLEDVD
jgi:hypothetical protein